MNEVYRSNGLRPETAFERYRNHTRDDAINDLVGVGLYGEQTSRWYRSFRGDQIHVTFLESMVAEPEAVWDDLSGFLGLRGAAIDISVRDKEYVEPRGAVGRIALRRPTVRKIGVALIPARARRTLKTRILGSTADKPVLSPDLRDSLRDYYRADCLRLEQVIERQLPWDWHHA
jgi:hypothetical protein